MTYQIILPNGTTLGTGIVDGTVDTTHTSLSLIGRNYNNYGQLMVDNFVDLLVNFATNNVPPTAPQAGQLWYNSNPGVVNVYSGSGWVPVGTAITGTTGGTPTITSVVGSFFLDTSYNQVYVCLGGSSWILVGPQANTYGQQGAVWEQLLDSSTNPHDVVSIYLDGTRTAIISSSTFTLQTAITGFGTAIKAGHNINSSYIIYGTANNASYLGNQPAANYWTNYLNNVGYGSLSILSNAGVQMGSLGTFFANVTATGTGRLYNTFVGGNVSFHVNSLVNGQEKALWISGLDGNVYVANDPGQPLGVATKQYVDNSLINANLTGVPTASTAPSGTATTQLATTAFVINNSGFLTNEIYAGGNSVTAGTYITLSSNSAIISMGNVIVATASPSGLNLYSGATGVTQTDTYNGTGSSSVATTQFVKNATQWWGGSAKFVSNVAPNPGVNDIGSNNGDFWFQISS